MSLIVLNPAGGLANRMRCIASGISLAKETEADFRVVWAVNDELAARFEDVFVVPEELKGRIAYPSAAAYALKYSIPRRKNLYVSALTLKRFSRSYFDSLSPLKEMMRESDNPLRPVLDSGIRSVYIQAGTIFHPFEDGFYRSLFRLNDEMQTRVDAAKQMLGPDYIGLHIRRTDNLMSISHSPDHLFEAEIEKNLEQDPSIKFYLATDSEATKQKFCKQFGPDKIICNPRPASRASLAGIKDAAVEMFLLAGASRIFGSFYSSYSEAASILGATPLRQLTTP